MKKSERKLEALELLKEAMDRLEFDEFADSGYTGKALAHRLGISHNSACNLLRRMRRQGLVRRKKGLWRRGKRGRREFEYSITEKGSERLEFFRSKIRKKFRF